MLMVVAASMKFRHSWLKYWLAFCEWCGGTKSIIWWLLWYQWRRVADGKKNGYQHHQCYFPISRLHLFISLWHCFPEQTDESWLFPQFTLLQCCSTKVKKSRTLSPIAFPRFFRAFISHFASRISVHIFIHHLFISLFIIYSYLHSSIIYDVCVEKCAFSVILPSISFVDNRRAIFISQCIFFVRLFFYFRIKRK